MERRASLVPTLLSILVFALAQLTGCAGSPYAVAKMEPAQLKQQPTETLLRACNSEYRRSQIVYELRKRQDIEVLDARECTPLLPEFVYRGDLRTKFVSEIQSRKVAVGMTMTELILSWGEPQSSRATNGPNGPVRHAYGSGGPYIYTMNGVVTGFEN